MLENLSTNSGAYKKHKTLIYSINVILYNVIIYSNNSITSLVSY